VDNVLDIGCGLGGINIFHHQHYQSCSKHYLLDKSQITDIYYKFERDAAAYNSLEITKKFLEMNGMQNRNLVTVNISEEDFPVDINFGIVISLSSWGIHYPLDTYIADVKEALDENGVVIVDIRKNTESMAVLDNHFKNINTIMDGEKSARVIADSPLAVR
jgi:16S rRNA G1207 methylase RsmC